MNPRLLGLLFYSLCLATFSGSLLAEVKLPAMFSDNAVLQHGQEVPVWGWAKPGSDVHVHFHDQTKVVNAGEDGKWMVRLNPLEVSTEPRVLKVTDAEMTLEVKNVLVGEVWFCSGQSNMEWPVGSCDIPDRVNPNISMIRHIDVPHLRAPQPIEDFMGQWTVSSSATFRKFMATGFYFAYVLNKELGVPIGIIDCSWGGRRIEPFTAPEGFRMVEELDAGSLRDTSTMFHGMVSGVKPYAIRGALWYQGESNGNEGMEYFHKKRALIQGWRQAWGQGDFPFYFVQLANYKAPNDDPTGGDGWARIREAQSRVISEVPNTGMAVIIDVGDEKDIHPKNKYDVGYRLALWALAKDYGRKNLVHSGPIYKSMERQGNAILLIFDHVGRGLMAGRKADPRSIEMPLPVDGLDGFAIAGTNRVWHWAEATIMDNKVVVTSHEVPNPVAVRYGFSMNPNRANLYNLNGLPASPFRTDDWDIIRYKSHRLRGTVPQ